MRPGPTSWATGMVPWASWLENRHPGRAAALSAFGFLLRHVAVTGPHTGKDRRTGFRQCDRSVPRGLHQVGSGDQTGYALRFQRLATDPLNGNAPIPSSGNSVRVSMIEYVNGVRTILPGCYVESSVYMPGAQLAVQAGRQRAVCGCHDGIRANQHAGRATACRTRFTSVPRWRAPPARWVDSDSSSPEPHRLATGPNWKASRSPSRPAS